MTTTRIKPTPALARLKTRLEKLELSQLREQVADLHAKLTQAETQLAQADETAEFWREQAFDMQQAIADETHTTHRAVGINKAGEMLVIKTN